ncbi:hypothetical protein XELAEV_18031614mg [Xenopus laevis]|uniref:Lymphocyte antigen 86 n=1 Tax=Xenopus laevis TaxID=8355 RepID=A0A974HFW1_XENLA|nr:hypothetical protein XELAEV_18031614mg [Xenopus laevis]
MKIYFAFVISLLLFCPGEMTEWPTHTLCNTGNFQAFYKSCDPLQDFGVDLSLCSPIAQDMKLRFGVLLRHNIKELFLAITAYFNGQLFLNYDYTICESSAPRFSFCGRKKGGNLFKQCIHECFYLNPLLYPFNNIPQSNDQLERSVYRQG